MKEPNLNQNDFILIITILNVALVVHQKYVSEKIALTKQG
jgi:hypothetical protein